MSSGSTPLGRPPRPVADVPQVEPEAIAKGWLLELVAAAPLQASAGLPVADIAAGGPPLCAALLNALRTDDGLHALSVGAPAAGAGSLAGAATPAAVVAGVEALRAAAWREFGAALPASADPGLVADLGHRLAHACAVIAQAALGQDSSVSSAFLVLEVDDLKRLEAAEPDGPLGADLEVTERELRSALRPGDRLTRERAGRWLVVAPGADATSGRELAERLSRAFAACAPLRHGTRLAMSIGLAVSPDDAGAAEAGLFAARAAGVPIVLGVVGPSEQRHRGRGRIAACAP